jgi:hypothetical protein
VVDPWGPRLGRGLFGFTTQFHLQQMDINTRTGGTVIPFTTDGKDRTNQSEVLPSSLYLIMLLFYHIYAGIVKPLPQLSIAPL